MTTKDILHETEIKMKKTVEATQREFSVIRTGRASTSLVEGIRVDYYGTPTPLKQLAALATPDAKLVTIQPWDKTVLPEIEKAILKSELGITPTNDGKVIRICVPPLTDERRIELDKILKKIAEDGRISIRSARHVAIEHAKKLEKEKAATEDERFKLQDDIQKATDRHIGQIDAALAAKEREIQA